MNHLHPQKSHNLDHIHIHTDTHTSFQSHPSLQLSYSFIPPVILPSSCSCSTINITSSTFITSYTFGPRHRPSHDRFFSPHDPHPHHHNPSHHPYFRHLRPPPRHGGLFLKMSFRNPLGPRLRKIITPYSVADIEGLVDIDRKPFDMTKLRGKVVYAVNVASDDIKSHENYELLVDLHKRYNAQGLEILAFPNNYFGQKEIRDNEEIKQYVRDTWNVKFHMMSKDDIEENKVFVLGMRSFPGEIMWNFHGKFLFNRNGRPAARFDYLTPPEVIDKHIAELLQEKFNKKEFEAAKKQYNELFSVTETALVPQEVIGDEESPSESKKESKEEEAELTIIKVITYPYHSKDAITEKVITTLKKKSELENPISELEAKNEEVIDLHRPTLDIKEELEKKGLSKEVNAMQAVIGSSEAIVINEQDTDSEASASPKKKPAKSKSHSKKATGTRTARKSKTANSSSELETDYSDTEPTKVTKTVSAAASRSDMESDSDLESNKTRRKPKSP